MWPVVTVDELVKRWRPLTEAEETVATARIADAEAEIQIRLREMGVTVPPTDELWVLVYRRTVAEAVRRYMINPDAWLEETERIDDYGVTKRRDSAVSAGLLYITDDEIAGLLPSTRRRRRGAFNIILGSS